MSNLFFFNRIVRLPNSNFKKTEFHTCIVIGGVVSKVAPEGRMKKEGEESQIFRFASSRFLFPTRVSSMQIARLVY